MRVTRRIGLLTTVGGLVVAAATVGTTAPAGATPSLGPATVLVSGTVLMAQPDGPGTHTSYAIALADGDLVPVTVDVHLVPHLSAPPRRALAPSNDWQLERRQRLARSAIPATS